MREILDAEERSGDGDIAEGESFLPQSHALKRQGLSLHRGWMVLIVTLNLVALLSIYLLSNSKKPISTFPNPFPSLEYEIRSFAEEYERDSSKIEKWDTKSDYPPGDGYTLIENAEVYGLPPGVLMNGKANLYGTAWTHQYHCLDYLHNMFEATLHNLTLETPSPHGDENDSGAGAEIHHVRHCFDYLRQHILCNMDMRLEYPTTNPKGINGYAIPRKCVRREPLDRYMGQAAATLE